MLISEWDLAHTPPEVTRETGQSHTPLELKAPVRILHARLTDERVDVDRYHCEQSPGESMSPEYSLTTEEALGRSLSLRPMPWRIASRRMLPGTRMGLNRPLTQCIKPVKSFDMMGVHQSPT